jgi:NADH dehydrogenase FAD-containing subunit
MNMAKHLVFVGAGHAHLMAIAKCADYIKRGHRVTVISSSVHHYYSGMGPGMLSGRYRPQDIRFNVKKMAEVRGAQFLEGVVTAVNGRNRVLLFSDGSNLSYDVASFNTGSTVPLESLTAPRENVFPVKPIINLLKAREVIKRLARERTPEIIVIGGGPAGLEVTGNAWGLVNSIGGRANITLISGHRLLNGFPDKAYRLARASLEARGIRLLEGTGADAIGDGLVRLSSGGEKRSDICLVATGVMPSTLFRESGIMTGPTQGILVNEYLQSVAYPEIFGGGDCIDLQGIPLNKVGVYAVREGPILHQNLGAALENGTLTTFRPQQTYMLIFNLGDGTGLLWKDKILWRGRLAMLLKNYIDTKFMRTYQLSGERDEPE